MDYSAETDVDALPSAAEIGLDVTHASPPTDAYVGKDDQLWIGTATQTASVVVTINARLLMPGGEIKLNQWTVAAPAVRSMAYKSFNLPESFILSIAATTNLTPGGGSCFVELLISRLAPSLFNSAQVLAQGYVNFNQPVCWPGGVQSTSVDCAGLIRTVGGTTPAAGANISDTVPANAKWQLMSMQFQLVTSAAVANRLMVVVLDDGLNAFASMAETAAQAASLTWIYTLAPSILSNAGANGFAQATIPNPTILYPGFRIRSNFLLLQAADQISQIIYQVQEWLLP